MSVWWQEIFASERKQAEIMKDIILKRYELEKNVSKWKSYVKALDTYFEKYKTNNSAILMLLERIFLIKVNLWSSQKEQDLRLIIEYIELKWEHVFSTAIEPIKEDLNNDEISKLLQMQESDIEENWGLIEKSYTLPWVKEKFKEEFIKDSIIIRNSKVASDLRTIQSKIDDKKDPIDWKSLISKKIKDHSTLEMFWEIGHLNYDTLQNNYGFQLKNDDFKNSYLIAYREYIWGSEYQLLWSWCKNWNTVNIRVYWWLKNLFQIDNIEYTSGDYELNPFLKNIAQTCDVNIPDLKELQALDNKETSGMKKYWYSLILEAYRDIYK